MATYGKCKECCHRMVLSNVRERNGAAPLAVVEDREAAGIVFYAIILYGVGGVGRVAFCEILIVKVGGAGDAEQRLVTVQNQNTAFSKTQTSFVLTRAEAYEVPKDVDRCYFFNPFSVELLQKVMARILDSYYETPREMLLFFYYPSLEYMSYLMTVAELEFYDEIPCGYLFDGEYPRETIVIFSLPD